MHTARTAILLALIVGLGAACSKDAPGQGPGDEQPAPGDGDGDGPGQTGPGEDGSTDHKPGVTPDEGATEFLSADAQGGETGSRNAGGLAGAPTADSDANADGAGSERTVERGDIFRVLGDGRILNLNAYRGLQILDVRDVSAPKVEGRLDLTGTPVELYVVGDRAIVLLNSWHAYYGSRDDIAVETETGGLVAVVDISNRAAPRLVDDAFVDGNITTSRLTQGDGAALYVAAQEYGDWSDGGSGVHTILRSFDVSGASLVAKSDLDLGGYVQDIQATTTVMMVASTSYDNNTGEQRSKVALVDISSPDGTMVLGAEVEPSGYVQNKFNMDVSGDVLRIVSGSSWSGAQTNHLETYDVSSLDTATPLDHCTFGDGQQLYATLFVENKAFFVTYLRQDPFHAFSVDAQGQCEEHAEFVVSGWNDFFRAAVNDTRLIGIGRNDEGASNDLAVSLYDISDIDNPSPLMDRDEINLTWASSEAQWDDRAFTVLEDAISVDANGVEESGIILLPFEGWDGAYQEYTASVQIFTFSATTLTRRGVMEHGSSVRRSFLVEDGAANLSEEQLSLYDIADPDAPVEQGRVDVAPSFTKVIALGDYVARVRDRGYYYYNPSGHLPTARVEIVPRSSNLDEATAIASFEIASGAQLVQVGDLLVSIQSVYSQEKTADEAVYDTTIEVFDVSDPTAPQKRGSLTTDKITPSYGGGYYGGYPGRGLHDGDVAFDCFDCGRYGYYYGGPSQLIAGASIVFPETTYKSESVGQAEYCYEYASSEGCAVSSNGVETCPEKYLTGGIECIRPLTETEAWCTGDIYECNYDGSGCELAPDAPTMRNCSTQERYRSWTQYSFEVLNLTDPDAPKLAPTVTTPDADEGTLAIADGTTIYFSYQQPIDVEDDARPYVRRFVRKLDVSDPAAPDLGNGINVPGDVIAVDGSSIFTRDIVWDDFSAETLIARLELDGGLARLRAQRLFDQRMVQNVTVDGAGHVLVSHDPVWSYVSSNAEQAHTLSILDEGNLGVDGATEIDNWASFVTAKDGKALFTVAGGVLVVNVENASAPAAQAYFATDGYWQPNLLLDAGEILFAAGPYGIYRFDSDTYNLRSR